MANITPMETAPSWNTPLSYFDDAISQCEQRIQQYWVDNPELYHLVQERKQQLLIQKEAHSAKEVIAPGTPEISDNAPTPSLSIGPLRGKPLRTKIREHQRDIRQRARAFGANITPRIGASNRKCAYHSIEQVRDYRADIVSAQIRAWRGQLPKLFRQFSKIPDYRRPGSTQHKITVLLVFGLFAFILRLQSRRDMNRELTSPVIVEHLKKLFPEIDSIPHADTLARLLERINPKHIEAIHVGLIRDLIKKKKFRKLLIHDCLPVTIDGTQKCYRNELLQDPRWCERVVGHPEDNNKQQTIYVVEATITLKNGLTIPLMSEYLHRENNELTQPEGKQDSETTAFERLAKRLKGYFPRLKMIFFMDAMYATQHIMGLLHDYRWEYVIRLPKRKLTDFAKKLNQCKPMNQSIPGQPAYRRRKQHFHWCNDLTYGYDWELRMHLVACMERYEAVDQKTGEMVERFSEHAWISSIRIHINNVHELLNCGARKKELMEDCINTEKHRGYHYKHVFSYDWNAMQGFHYLMRLGHAINAISEFTKSLKKYIQALGSSATLNIIKDTLCHPWLPLDWYEQQSHQHVQLRLQLE